MPGGTEGPDPRSGGAGPGSGTLAVVGCLLSALALLTGIVSLVVHYAVTSPTSPYQIVFSASGTECVAADAEDSDLVLDEETGEVLYCGLLPPVHDSGRAYAGGAFSAEEVGRVTGLSRSLASDGDLSGEDRQAVAELVAEISRERGYEKMSPTLLERVTWTVGLCGVIGGLAVLVGLGLLAHYLDPPPR
ncbi:hypothetical protein [Streptomyces sp. URMC 129]|uniref:hypothetical protein n=1 Tax=Streptomyces sp. URMC 129 TaxID=3423407 RepID=UPI003F198599